MRRINLVLPDHYFSQLQEEAAKKNISLARYTRDLIDIGRQVEEATAQKTEPGSTKNNPTSRLGDAKALWKNSLLCALESRYLIRYLVDHLTDQSSEKRDAVLNAVKEKAQTLVAEWIDE